jgi:hypothetical protein
MEKVHNRQGLPGTDQLPTNDTHRSNGSFQQEVEKTHQVVQTAGLSDDFHRLDLDNESDFGGASLTLKEKVLGIVTGSQTQQTGSERDASFTPDSYNPTLESAAALVGMPLTPAQEVTTTQAGSPTPPATTAPAGEEVEETDFRKVELSDEEDFGKAETEDLTSYTYYAPGHAPEVVPKSPRSGVTPVLTFLASSFLLFGATGLAVALGVRPDWFHLQGIWKILAPVVAGVGGIVIGAFGYASSYAIERTTSGNSK